MEMVLLRIPKHHGKIEKHGNPGSGKEETEEQKRLHKILGQHKLVQFVAEINGVDVIAFQIGEHDDIKDHPEEQDG